MATLLSAILTKARIKLLEETANFWTDEELVGHMNDGIKDLWKGILDLYQDHFVTIDATNMSLAANTSSITGVPTDLFRIVAIKPRTLNSANSGLVFSPRTLTHPDFVQAEAIQAVEPVNNTIYYAVINAGAPVGAPSIRVAPQISTAVPLEVVYTPTIAAKTAAEANPIPGESDLAIEMWTLAFARAKESKARQPDPEYISIYATEKANLLKALTPRSVQEPEYVVGMFEPPASGVSFGNW